MSFKAGAAIALAVGALFSSAVLADTFVGNSSAVFGIPGPAGSVYSGQGTNEIITGTPANNSQANSLLMVGQPFNVNADTPFAVSLLTYHNGQTANSATVFPVSITLDFSTPAGLSHTFNFTYDLEETTNNHQNPADNADILTVPTVFSPTNFTVGGNVYTLKLLGFSNDMGNTIDSQFILPEDQTVTSSLFAEITAPPPPTSVPLPSSVYMGGAILAAVVIGRFRRRRMA